MARYKDATVQLNFYTKTRRVIKTEEFLVSDYFSPQLTTNFGPYKLYPPQGYDSYELEIKDASYASYDRNQMDSTAVRYRD